MSAYREPDPYYDIKGYPAAEGDVIKIYQFTGARRRKFFMYKVIVVIEGYYYAMCISEIPTKWEKSHKCLLKHVVEFEIVDGRGPEKRHICWLDRDRIKPVTPQP